MDGPLNRAVSYERAREIVRRATEPDWDFGTYCLDDRVIAENDDMYAFVIGAREWIVHGDLEFQAYGGLPVVYKKTGALAWLAAEQLVADGSLIRRPNPDPTLVV